MFDGVRSFNGVVNGWETTSVLYMSYIFDGAVSFDKSVLDLDIRSVVD